MTICSSLPDLSEFTTVTQDQANFFAAIEDVVNQLCNAQLITFNQSTRPTQEDFETAYLAANPLNTFPIPTSQVFHWYNGDIIKGVFRTLDDVETGATMRMNVNYAAYTGAFSKNDDRFAIGSKRHSDATLTYGFGFELCLMRIGGEDREVLVASASALTNHLHPSWNDTSDAIAYQSERNGVHANYQIYKVNDDATGDTRLTNNVFEDQHPSWNGSLIVFDSDEYGNTQIIRVTDAGAARTRLTNNAFNDSYPQYSPDGTKIVFVSDRDGQDEIYIMDSDGSNQTRLTVAPSSSVDSRFPTVSPDGLYIYYTNNEYDTSTFSGLLQSDIFRMDLDGSNKTLIRRKYATPASDYRSYKWYPTYFGNIGAGKLSVSYDGTRVLWSADAQLPEVWQNLSTISDDYRSTGKVYMVSQWVEPHGNFRLLQTLKPTTGDTTAHFYGSDIPDDTQHLMIVMEAAGVAALTIEGVLSMMFNGDATAANYITMINEAQTAAVSRYETLANPGIALPISGSNTPAYSNTYIMLIIPDFRSTDSLKQIFAISYSRVYDNTTRIYSRQIAGIWNNTNPITQIDFQTSAALTGLHEDTVISLYAMPGETRW